MWLAGCVILQKCIVRRNTTYRLGDGRAHINHFKSSIGSIRCHERGCFERKWTIVVVSERPCPLYVRIAHLPDSNAAGIVLTISASIARYTRGTHKLSSSKGGYSPCR